MPEGENKGKEITIEIKRPELIALLVFSLVILVLELNATYATKINFGDEGFHTRLAQLMAQEKDYFAFYPFYRTPLIQLGYDRPPLWNLLEAGFFLLFGFSEVIVKSLTPFIAAMTGLAICLLGKRLLDEKVAFIAAVVAITIPSFVTYSVLFYTDMLLSFYTALSVLLFAIASKHNSRKYFALSAVFASLAFLTKAPGLASILFFGLALLYEMFIEKRHARHLAKRYGMVFLIVIAVTSGFFVRNYALFGTPYCYRLPGGFSPFDTKGCSIDNYNNTYAFSERTAAGGTEQSVYSIGIMNYLNFAFGNVWFVVFGAIAGFLLLLQKRDRAVDMLLLFLAFFLMLFPMITDRAEDTARYTLSWVFVFAILAASFFSGIHGIVAKYNKYISLTVFVVVLFLSYQNFQPKLNAMVPVKQFSPAFFQACDWVKDNLPENVTLYTIWGHRAIYNCQRNVAGSLPDLVLNGSANGTAAIARMNGIDYLFIQKFSIDPQDRNLTEMYNLRFVNMLEGDNRTFVKVYENGPSLQQCLQQGGCDGNIIYRIDGI